MSAETIRDRTGLDAPPPADAGATVRVPPRRSRLVWVGVLVVLVVGGLVAVAMLRPATPAGSASPPVPTATVARGTLSVTTDVDGTLNYGTAVPLGSSASGTLTWLPPIGTVVRRGQSLFRVDEAPVVLFYGGVPMYRTVGVGDHGRDVAEIEANLRALGYGGFTVDDTYTSATATVVRELQHDLGRPETGTVTGAWVVIQPGAVRVASDISRLGAAASASVLSVTGGTKVVVAQVAADAAGWARDGAEVTVVLPDSRQVPAVVADVSSTVSTSSSDSGGDEQQPTIAVTLSIKDQTLVSAYTEAPVHVRYVTEHHDNVLTVPVAALLALAEGGYGLEVSGAGGAHSTVAVTVGLIANGQAEVSGSGIGPGTVVVMPG